jgi:hypothetical protein
MNVLQTAEDGQAIAADAEVTVFSAGLAGRTLTHLLFSSTGLGAFNLSFDGGTTYIRFEYQYEPVLLTGLSFREGDTLKIKNTGASLRNVFASMW